MWRKIFMIGFTVSLCAALSLETFTTNAPSGTRLGSGCGVNCCAGRNNTCFSSGFKINGKGAPNGMCFCDEGCLDMQDCCFDYKTSCKAVDCEVSDWTNFTDCSIECGVGIQTRSRSIVVEPKFGGQTCPTEMTESKVCTGTNCPEEEVEITPIWKETAKIMPASYGRFRNMKEYNANMDIRKNLYDKYYSKDEVNYTGYCSRFKVVSSRSGCKSYYYPWANVLQKGAVICVQCQGTAMEKENSNGMCAGHGEDEVSTNWNAVNARGCQGWWQRLPDTEECSCDARYDFIFI